ncbi:hypothetical protein V6Z96_006714 [Aspergillus fumigatus]
MYPTRALRMQASRPFAFPLPKENQSAHTISQRLRTLKRVPPELIPLGIVLRYVDTALFLSIRDMSFPPANPINPPTDAIVTVLPSALLSTLAPASS